ncbi:MAG: FtsX-like permease family protein [Bacillota bacterium]|nr:FtsX-like permease family protein [Bacillota bacterium]
MLRLVLDRLLSKPWMTASLLLANWLLVAIVAANVLYTDAVSQRTLIRDLERELLTRQRYPVEYQLSWDLDHDPAVGRGKHIDPVLERARAIPQQAGLETQMDQTVWTTDRLRMYPELRRGDSDPVRMAFGTIEGYEDKIRVLDWAWDLGCSSAEAALAGWAAQPGLDWPGSGGAGSDAGSAADLAATGILDAFVSENTLIALKLIPGEIYEVLAQYGLNMNYDPECTVFRVRIAGVIAAGDPADSFWSGRQLDATRGQLWLPAAAFEQSFITSGPGLVGLKIESLVRIDYTRLRLEDVEPLLEASRELGSWLDEREISHTERFVPLLESVQLRSRRLTLTLLLLQLPLALLLVAYIVMVAGRLAAMESDEIAQLGSRGASRGQIIRIYLIQGLVLAAVAILAGIPLAFLLTGVIGSAAAFLSFVSREALPLRLQPAVPLAAAAAAAVGLVAMLIPSIRASGHTIVERKRSGRAGSRLFHGVRFLLAAAAIALSLYVLYGARQRQTQLAMDIREGRALDGMLFMASSLFMLGVALLVAQLVPWLIRLVFRLTRRLWGAALHVSFLQMIRSRTSYSFIVVLLVLTVAMGIFGARAARTINLGSEDEILYRNGADFVLREEWGSNAEEKRINPEIELVFYEPDFAVYEAIPGVERAARVFSNGEFRVRCDQGRVDQVMMLGIHTKEFGETLNFIDGLLPEHINSYLNAMSRDPRAVLLSENFRREFAVEIGDVITYYDPDDHSSRGIVAGFVPYFPSFVPLQEVSSPDGSTRLEERFLIVAGLAELQARLGLYPYEVWLRTSDPDAVLDFLETGGRRFYHVTDSRADLIAMRNDPTVQGTNGILTISFVITLLLCVTGFLIYWILSIRERTLVFGIHRAMGLSQWEILAQLINEQLFITLPALAGGLACGLLTARLFVPLIQATYAAVDQALPLRMPAIGSDILRLGVILGLMVLVCLVILLAYIRRIRIAQALKLGEE